jgi:hypothetical protein
MKLKTKLSDYKVLYHGTSSANLQSIELHGLCPLKFGYQVQNEWPDFTVNPELVFLTKKLSQAQYAAEFSVIKHGGEIMILEIDPKTLDKKLCRADDNYHITNNWEMSKTTHKNRAYLKSLSIQGHIGYMGIIKQFTIKGK